jgi:hypothetical protein
LRFLSLGNSFTISTSREGEARLMTTLLKQRWLCVTFFVACTAAANAFTLIGNYPPTNDGTQSATLNDLRVKAMAFTMPGTTYALQDVTLRLRSSLGASPLVTIRGGGANPGGVLATLTGGPVGALGDYTYTPTSALTLLAGQQYWLVVGGAGSTGSVDWMASSPGITPTGLATHSGNLFTTNGGTSWTTSSIVNTYQVNAVPEPATLAALGVGALALIRRRRAKA